MNSATTSPTSCDYLTRDADRALAAVDVCVDIGGEKDGDDSRRLRDPPGGCTSLFVGLCRGVSSPVVACRGVSARVEGGWMSRGGADPTGRSGITTQGWFPSVITAVCSGPIPGTAETSDMQNVKAPWRSSVWKSGMCNGWRVTGSLFFTLPCVILTWLVSVKSSYLNNKDPIYHKITGEVNGKLFVALKAEFCTFFTA